MFGSKLELQDPRNVEVLEKNKNNQSDIAALPLPEYLKGKLWIHVNAIMDIVQIYAGRNLDTEFSGHNSRNKYFTREKVLAKLSDFEYHLKEIENQRMRIFEVISKFSYPFKKKFFVFKSENEKILREIKKFKKAINELNRKIESDKNTMNVMQILMNHLRSGSGNDVSISTLLPKELQDYLFEQELVMLSYIITTLSDEIALLEKTFFDRKKILIEMTSKKLIEQALYDLQRSVKKRKTETERKISIPTAAKIEEPQNEPEQQVSNESEAIESRASTAMSNKFETVSKLMSTVGKFTARLSDMYALRKSIKREEFQPTPVRIKPFGENTVST